MYTKLCIDDWVTVTRIIDAATDTRTVQYWTPRAGSRVHAGGVARTQHAAIANDSKRGAAVLADVRCGMYAPFKLTDVQR